MIALLASRRFGPLFATQFLGAFNDNFYKTAMLFLVTYRLLAADPASAATLVTLAAGLLMLPFLLFSGVAGSLADAVDKARVARWVKTAEVGIMLVGAAALSTDSIPLLLGVVFAMGLHSTVFGPVKYAVLPQYLSTQELLGGTGLVEAGTFVAVLLGQVAGGLLPLPIAAGGVVAVALLGRLAAQYMPPAPPAADAPRIDWNPWTTSVAALRGAFANPRVRSATLAISWFWALGAVYTSQFIPLVKTDLHASPAVATLFLAAFSVGIAVGSLGVARLLRGRISGVAAPWAAVALAAFSVELFFAVRAMPPASGVLGIADILARASGWRILADLLGLAAAGGVFSVPLYAILQTASGEGARARAVAANNIVNAVFIVGAALAASTAVARGVPVAITLLVTGLTALLLLPLLLGLRRATASAAVGA